MQNNNASGFRIGRDDETSESFPRPTPQAVPDRKRLEQLRRRVAIMTLLLPCIVIGMGIFGYYEIKRRFDQLNQSSLTELQTQAQALETRFSELMTKYEALQETQNDKEEPLTEAFLVFERTTASLKEAVESLKTRVANVEINKADADEIDETLAKTLSDFQTTMTTRQEEEIQKLRESMAAVQEATEQARQEAVAAAEKTAAEVALTFEPFQADMEKLTKEMDRVKQDVVDVLGETITLKKFNDGLNAVEKNLNGDIEALSRKAAQNAKTINTLGRQLNDLENRLLYLERRGGGKSGAGGIIEQDIN